MIIDPRVGKFRKPTDMVGVKMGDDQRSNVLRSNANLSKLSGGGPFRNGGSDPAVQLIGPTICGSKKAIAVSGIADNPALTGMMQREEYRVESNDAQGTSVDRKQRMEAVAAIQVVDVQAHRQKMPTP